MKKQVKLSIHTPCQEKFKTFYPTEQGRFCHSCSTEVIDFTQMTDQDIVDFFDQEKRTICGRFQKSQLKSYSPIHTSTSTNYATLGVVGLSLVMWLTEKIIF